MMVIVECAQTLRRTQEQAPGAMQWANGGRLLHMIVTRFVAGYAGCLKQTSAHRVAVVIVMTRSKLGLSIK